MEKSQKANACCAGEATPIKSPAGLADLRPQRKIDQAPDKGLQPVPSPTVSCCSPQIAAYVPLMDEGEPCCGPKMAPPSSPMEKPGYRLWHFVEDLLDTPAGPVPKVKTDLMKPDILGSIAARASGVRNDYKITPGLYAVGRPGPEDMVLVTANYKLTFDDLRKRLSDRKLWILVLDTRGINVWCAAGKKTFGTSELIHRVQQVGLERIVTHRRLILPQLGATGVSAQEVKRGCGFEVIWGPVRSEDIPAFIDADYKAEPSMRRVTFNLWERLVLIPIELSHLTKPFLWSMLIIFILSGIGPWIFEPDPAWYRGWTAILGVIAGILGGAVAAPALLPWLPGRAFAIKGALSGSILGLGAAVITLNGINWLEGLTLVLLSATISSYLAMNFTGSTPYTSPSGVEKEMRKAIPLQALAVVLSAVLWVTSTFLA